MQDLKIQYYHEDNINMLWTNFVQIHLSIISIDSCSLLLIKDGMEVK